MTFVNNVPLVQRGFRYPGPRNEDLSQRNSIVDNAFTDEANLPTGNPLPMIFKRGLTNIRLYHYFGRRNVPRLGAQTITKRSTSFAQRSQKTFDDKLYTRLCKGKKTRDSPLIVSRLLRHCKIFHLRLTKLY